jgi:hypothetical protein
VCTSKSCTSNSINLHDFNLLILTNARLGSKLVNVTSNTILLNNTYFILYGPNHFLANFPRCDLLPFGNHRTKSLNLKCFLVFFCWFHKDLFHYYVINFTSYCNLSYCNFFSVETLIVRTFMEFPSLWLLSITGRMYPIGIKGCNPYKLIWYIFCRYFVYYYVGKEDCS